MSLLLQHIQFNKTLHEIYEGKVTCLGNFTTPNANLRFQCDGCHTRFYGKCSNVIGNDLGHRHKCFHNYADRHSNRKEIKYNFNLNKHRIEEINTIYSGLKDIYLVADKLNVASYYVYLIVNDLYSPCQND